MHRVKELREAKGISVRHLALATGFSHSTIARLERGERKLSTPQAVALADYFGVSVDFLRGDFMTELLHGDGDVTQSLSDSVREPVRTKLEILFLLRGINSKESLDMILNLAKLRSAKADFAGED